MKVALTIEYDGTNFSGWQRQENAWTIQQCLEEALGVYCSSLARKSGVELHSPLQLKASGRTDAGVHARGQVASFTWPQELPFDAYVLQGALNGLTPKDIAILNVAEKDETFDARFSAVSKCYEYRILNRLAPATNQSLPVWHVHSRLDWGKLKAVAQLYRGEHDFSAFCASDGNQSSSVRRIYQSEISRCGRDEYVYIAVGNGFLKQMIRILVGTMVDVAMETISLEQVRRALEGGQRGMVGKTAPARGLTLAWVCYDEAFLSTS